MRISRVTRTADGLDLQADPGWLRVEAMDERIVHVVYTNKPELPRPNSLMVVRSAPAPVDWDAREEEETIEFRLPELTLQIARKTGAFTWREKTGALLVREPQIGGKSLREAKDGGPDAVSARLDFEFSAGEAIYGLGQHEEGILNYRGHSQILYQHNLKVAMPVIVSTRGYAVFFDTLSLANFHDDQYGTYFWSEAEDTLNFYFLYGPSFDRLVAGIRWLTGQVPLLPRWAYGYIQSKERYKRQSELVETVQEYRRRGIGLDCIVQDWLSWPGKLWGQKTLDPDRFPDPDKMMQDLHELNARMMISVWPKFSNDGPDQVEMREHGFLLEDGKTFDAFNPAARALFWKQANEGLFRHGIDAWWCDCTEPFDTDWHGTIKPEPWQQMVENTARSKQYLDPKRINAYSLLHSQGIYMGQRASGSEKRVVNLTRSGSPGQARYGTITWSGDISASWETLRRQIPEGLNFTVTGSPRWTFDIGGFFVDRHPDQWFWNGEFPNGCEDRAYRELYARWFQVGAFLPMFRAHGTDTPREVWRFGKPGEIAYDALVKFIRLRYRMLPYIYSLAAQETFHGYTMLRNLAFDFRHDPLVYDIADEFLFGPSLLVCPVLEPMYYGPEGHPLEQTPKERTIYLPAGCSWYNFWTGKRYAGGQLLRTPAPLDIVPLFVRAGSILPLGPDVQHAGEKRSAPIELRVYPGEDGRFDLYDDEGDSYRYEQGEYTWTALSWHEFARTLHVGPRTGSFRKMPAKQTFRVVLAGPGIEPGEAVGEVEIAGKEKIPWEDRAGPN